MANVDIQALQRPSASVTTDSEPAGSEAPTPAQIDIIKSTVPILAEHGETITTHFYDRLLADNSSLKNIFNLSNQSNKRQPRALAGALHAYAANIDNLPALAGAVELITQRHASLYVQPEHYGAVGSHLLGAMQDVLGAALTPDVLAAWAAAYWQLANLMIGKEKALYNTAAERKWDHWKPLRVVRKVREGDEITSLYLEPVDGTPLPDFKPGQYISVRVNVPQLEYLQPRQYSLSDAPNGKSYRISVKRETAGPHPGVVSNLLHDSIEEGHVVDVSHPFGDFLFDSTAVESDAPIVLLSAGVGLTSVTSIFNSLVVSGSPARPITFVHGARRNELRAFDKEYRRIAEEKHNVKVVLFNKHMNEGKVSNDLYHRQGRVEVAKLDRDSELHLDDKRTIYFVCGPDSFMADVQAALKDQGVDPDRLHSEFYGPQR